MTRFEKNLLLTISISTVVAPIWVLALCWIGITFKSDSWPTVEGKVVRSNISIPIRHTKEYNGRVLVVTYVYSAESGRQFRAVDDKHISKREAPSHKERFQPGKSVSVKVCPWFAGYSFLWPRSSDVAWFVFVITTMLGLVCLFLLKGHIRDIAFGPDLQSYSEQDWDSVRQALTSEDPAAELVAVLEVMQKGSKSVPAIASRTGFSWRKSMGLQQRIEEALMLSRQTQWNSFRAP